VIAAALERRDAVRERDAVAHRLTALAALVPGVVYQLHMDAHGTLRFPYASPGIRSVFGVDPEDVTADAGVAFSRVHADDVAELQASIEVSRASLREWVQEFRMHHPVMGTRWVRAHAAPERTPDGGTLWHGVVTDTTESRLMEDALRRDVVERERARALLEREVAFRRALVDVTNDMLAASLGDDFYQEVLERTISLVPDAQGGSMVLRDEDGRYRYVAAVGFDLDVLVGIRLSAAELARSHPPAVERIYVRASPTLPPERCEALARAGRLADIQVTLSVPIVVSGEVQGFMNLDNFEHPDAFDPPARSTAQALAAQVAVALQRLHLERDLEQERSRYQRLASHDPLTNLPNRRLFQDRLEQAITHAHRRREHVALIYLDLDGFKHVNDTLGHVVGDELLEAVAARLVMAVRAVDTVARLGGDEFAVVLQEVGTDRDAELVAEKLLAAFAAPFVLRGRSLAVGVSIGVAIYPRDAGSSATLMKAADLAMYHVKDAGKGAYAFFSAVTGPLAPDGS
jgi:diguanylate cyclase (GGDEF)-like protein